jgi:hypothetical protein
MRTLASEKKIISPGTKMGMLTVLGLVEGKTSFGYRVYRCQCDCGKMVERGSGRLRDFRCRVSCGNHWHRPLGAAAAHVVYLNYQTNAKRRGHVFELSEDEFLAVCEQDCHYCGAKPKSGNWKHFKRCFGDFSYNGIDRKDNSLGYIIGNCLPCCGTCNYSKRGLSYQEYISQCQRVAILHPC